MKLFKKKIYYCHECKKKVCEKHKKKHASHHVISFGWIKDPEDKRDIKWRHLFRLTEQPDYVNLLDYLGDVRDQDGEGICVGMACAGLKDYWEKREEDYPEKGLSPRCIYNGGRWLEQRLNEEGCYIRDTLKFLQKYGTCMEVEWPFYPHVEDDVAPLDKFNEEVLKPWRIKTYVKLESINEICQALASGSVVVAGVPWFENWMIPDSNGLLPTPDGRILGYHAVLIYGYDHRDDGKLLVRNSWGDYWGVNGNFMVNEEDLEKYWEECVFWTVVDLQPEPKPKPKPKPSPSICKKLDLIMNLINKLKKIYGCE